MSFYLDEEKWGLRFALFPTKVAERTETATSVRSWFTWRWFTFYLARSFSDEGWLFVDRRPFFLANGQKSHLFIPRGGD